MVVMGLYPHKHESDRFLILFDFHGQLLLMKLMGTVKHIPIVDGKMQTLNENDDDETHKDTPFKFMSGESNPL